MTYVEWLRVRNCLKWTAIALAVMVALVLFARFTYLDVNPHKSSASWLTILGQNFSEFEASSQETQSTLPDGTRRTVIVNQSKGARITIDDRGYWGKHIEVFERKPLVKGTETMVIGDLHFVRRVLPNGTLVATVDLGAAVPEDLDYYFGFAGLIAMLVATMLGAPFAREGDGHLELALTKPISRARLGLNTIAVDLAGILIAWVMTVGLFVIGHTIFEAPNYTFGPDDLTSIVCGILGAFAWYSMLCAATASLKRAYGTVLGISWPVASIVYWLSVTNLGSMPVARLVNAIAWIASRIDPLSYLAFFPKIDVTDSSATLGSASTTTTDIYLLSILALVYGAAALIQWRRVEA